MIELVLGGARSGKSRYAESVCKHSQLTLHYIATAQALDDEMTSRITHHQHTRSDQWMNIEEPLDLAKALNSIDNDKHIILVDCLTLWLSNHLLLTESIWLQQRESFLQALPTLQAHIVLVSNEVGQGIVPLGAINRQFVDEAGRLHQDIAALADKVSFVTAGIVQTLKSEKT